MSGKEKDIDAIIDGTLKRTYFRTYIPEDDGGYSASIPEFSGCFAEGDTLEEAKANLEIAARAWIEGCLEDGLDIPKPFIDSTFPNEFIIYRP